MLTVIRSISAVAILAAAGSAGAQPLADDAAPTAVVRFADLDIGAPAGLRALHGRIHAAASRLCLQAGRQSLEIEMAQFRCMSAALASAQVGVEQARARRAVRLAERAEIQVTGR
jgi:UrcA family protein